MLCSLFSFTFLAHGPLMSHLVLSLAFVIYLLGGLEGVLQAYGVWRKFHSGDWSAHVHVLFRAGYVDMAQLVGCWLHGIP